MKVMIIEKNYDTKRLYNRPNLIYEWEINRSLEQLIQQGYRIVNVQMIDYSNLKIERVLITYD